MLMCLSCLLFICLLHMRVRTRGWAQGQPGERQGQHHADGAFQLQHVTGGGSNHRSPPQGRVSFLKELQTHTHFYVIPCAENCVFSPLQVKNKQQEGVLNVPSLCRLFRRLQTILCDIKTHVITECVHMYIGLLQIYPVHMALLEQYSSKESICISIF